MDQLLLPLRSLITIRGRATLSRTPPSLQLQPRIFSHQISSTGAVALSPRGATLSGGPVNAVAGWSDQALGRAYRARAKSPWTI